MSVPLDVPVLHGSRVRLEPLAMEHAADLALAAEEDRSSYGFTLVPTARRVPLCNNAAGEPGHRGGHSE